MGKGSNIVHEYFRKEFEDMTILVRLNPIQFTGTEITLYPDGKSNVRDLEFDQQIHEDLKHDGFTAGSPLEFNLHYHGLVNADDSEE